MGYLGNLSYLLLAALAVVARLRRPLALVVRNLLAAHLERKRRDRKRI